MARRESLLDGGGEVVGDLLAGVAEKVFPDVVEEVDLLRVESFVRDDDAHDVEQHGVA